MRKIEVTPNNTDAKRISIDSKIKLKLYIRLYFFLNHKLRQLNEKVSDSGKFGFSKQQKNTILEQYFSEDINNINRLGSSADMFFIKPYFEHLCNNSYDDDCNNYRKYLNTLEIIKKFSHKKSHPDGIVIIQISMIMFFLLSKVSACKNKNQFSLLFLAPICN